MAKKEGEYININKLQGVAAGSSKAKAAKALYVGSTKSYRAYSGNTIVWDMWRACLEIPDSIKIPAIGGTTKNLIMVDSHYKDYNNADHELDYSVSPATIASNTTTSTKSHSLTITQNTTDLSISITLTQEANSSNVTWGTPKLNHVSVMEMVDTGSYIPASGGSAIIVANISQQKTTTNTSGSGNKTETITQYVPIVSITGTTYNGGTASGDKISIESRSNVEGPIRDVYKITKVKYNALDGKEYEGNASLTVQQEANTKTAGTSTYDLAISSSNTEFNAMPVLAEVNVTTATQTTSYTYTSGYNDGNDNKVTSNASWTATCTGNGTVDHGSSGTGPGTVSVLLKSNTNQTLSVDTTVNVYIGSHTSKYITFTQSKDELSGTSTSSASVHNVAAESVMASGGNAGATMTVKVVSTPLYISGATGTPTTTYKTATITSISGSAVNNSGAYISGTKVVVKSLGTIEKISGWDVFKITSVTGTYNNTSYTWNGECYVTQGSNTKHDYSSYTYNIDLSTSDTLTGISNTGKTLNLTASCSKSRTYTWTSGEPGSESSSASATISATGGTLSKTSITGNNQTLTWKIGENTDVARSFTATIKSNDNSSTTDSITASQNAVELIIDGMNDHLLTYEAQTQNITAECTRNGSAYTPTVTSNQTWATVGTITNSGTTYNIPVTVTANTSETSSRTAELTIKLSSGSVNKTATTSITQAKYVQPKPTKTAYFTGTFEFGANPDGTNNKNLIRVSDAGFSAVDTSSTHYTGGTLKNVTFIVSNKRDGTGTQISSKNMGDISVPFEGSTDISLTSLTGGSTAQYVLIYYNNTLQGAYGIMLTPEIMPRE